VLTPIQAGEPSTVDCLEGETPQYTATITDDLGAPLPAASLSTLTLTLYVIKSDGTTAYVNSRNAQNVLNANNVTVSGVGLVTWSLQVADTSLIEDLPFERHIALWEWTWPTARAGKHELMITVKALGEVP
jgi:hypothetical protein